MALNHNSDFGDIEIVICKYLRDPRWTVNNNFDELDLDLDEIGILVLDNGLDHNSTRSGVNRVGVTVFGKANDIGNNTEAKSIAREIIAKIKASPEARVGLEEEAQIISVERVFGPIRIQNQTRPELLISFELKIQGF